MSIRKVMSFTKWIASIVRKQETAQRSFHTLKASSHSDEIKIHRHSHKCLKYHQLTIAVLYLTVILASVKFHFSATSYFKHYGACFLSGNCHFHFIAWFPVPGKEFLITRKVTIYAFKRLSRLCPINMFHFKFTTTPDATLNCSVW